MNPNKTLPTKMMPRKFPKSLKDDPFWLIYGWKAFVSLFNIVLFLPKKILLLPKQLAYERIINNSPHNVHSLNSNLINLKRLMYISLALLILFQFLLCFWLCVKIAKEFYTDKQKTKKRK